MVRQITAYKLHGLNQYSLAKHKAIQEDRKHNLAKRNNEQNDLFAGTL